MDPNTHPGPEEYGEQGGPAGPVPESAGRPGGSDGAARVVRLVTGPYLVTVNPVDGCEIQPCPPGERPAAPEKRDAQDRAETARAALPPAPTGPLSFAGHAIPLEERDEDVARLIRLLTRGRSVRVTGPAGSGRTRLLDAVAGGVADLAPDGVVRLSGYHRSVADVLYALFAAVYRAPQYRPERPELLRLLGEIGAVVVLDDLEFGGAALDELLDATPECAFLLAATPDVPAPSADAHVEEVFVGGISQAAGVRLLERAVDRPLTRDEKSWAADLWFESEGLPLRFVQGAALLRQRDKARTAPGALDDGYGLFPEDGTADPEQRPEAPLPALGEAAAPAPLLAARLGAAAQEALRFAVALGGELPHQAHLPALTQDTQADAALGELLGCGLISPAGGHYRLAATVQDQLTAAGYAEDAPARAHAAAQHYAWWAGHPSVTPERAAAESDAVLAAMGVLTGSRESGHPAAAVLLARTAAPAFAAALHWSAWERSLRHGQEAARLAGEVAEEAYFHHDLGVLALCSGNVDRARAELEASIGLRGVLSDRDGAVAGRRALALVIDRARAASADAPTTLIAPVAATPTPEEANAPTGHETAAAPVAESSPDAVSTAKLHKAVGPKGAAPAAATPGETTVTLPAAKAAKTARTPVAAAPAAATGASAKSAAAGGGSATGGVRHALRRTGRRNLLAAGAGVLLAAALGTVVTLGMASDNTGPQDDKKVTTEQSSTPSDDTGQPARETGTGLPPTGPGTTRPGTPSHRPTTSPSAPGTTGAPTGPGTPTGGPTSGSGSPTGGSTSSSGHPTHSHTPTDSPDPTPTDPTPSTSGGSTGGGSTSGGSTGGGSTSGGSTGGGSTSGGSTSGGSTSGGSTSGGSPSGGSTGGGSTSGGSTGGSPSGSSSAVAPSTSTGNGSGAAPSSSGQAASSQGATGQGAPTG